MTTPPDSPARRELDELLEQFGRKYLETTNGDVYGYQEVLNPQQIESIIAAADAYAETVARERELRARLDEAERKGENKDYGVVHYNADGSTFMPLDNRIAELEAELAKLRKEPQ